MCIFWLITSSKNEVNLSLVSLDSTFNPVQLLTTFQPISGLPQYLQIITERHLVYYDQSRTCYLPHACLTVYLPHAYLTVFVPL